MLCQCPIHRHAHPARAGAPERRQRRHRGYAADRDKVLSLLNAALATIVTWPPLPHRAWPGLGQASPRGSWSTPPSSPGDRCSSASPSWAASFRRRRWRAPAPCRVRRRRRCAGRHDPRDLVAERIAIELRGDQYIGDSDDHACSRKCWRSSRQRTARSHPAAGPAAAGLSARREPTMPTEPPMSGGSVRTFRAGAQLPVVARARRLGWRDYFRSFMLAAQQVRSITILSWEFNSPDPPLFRRRGCPPGRIPATGWRGAGGLRTCVLDCVAPLVFPRRPRIPLPTLPAGIHCSGAPQSRRHAAAGRVA